MKVKITEIEKDWRDEYSYIGYFFNGCARIRKKEGGLWGIIDDKNKVIVPCEYDDIYKITNNSFEGTKGDKKYKIEIE